MFGLNLQVTQNLSHIFLWGYNYSNTPLPTDLSIALRLGLYVINQS